MTDYSFSNQAIVWAASTYLAADPHRRHPALLPADPGPAYGFSPAYGFGPASGFSPASGLRASRKRPIPTAIAAGS